jgi:hypothetical protein
MPRPDTKLNLAQRIEMLNQTTRDFSTLQPNARVLFYGDSGSGKTVLSVRLAQKITPPDMKIVYVDTSEGWVSLMNHPPELRNRVVPVVYDGYTQLETLVEAIAWCKKNPGKVPQWDNVGCVVIDEFSVAIRNDLNLVTKVRAESPEGVKEGKDPYAPMWPDMRHSTHKASTIERAILGLDLHVIFTCHERNDKDKSGAVKTTFSLMRETREYVKEPLHLVGRVKADIVKGATDAGNLYRRSVQCHPSALVDAKSRIGNLQISEDFTPLIDKISTWLTQGATPVDERAEITTPEEATQIALAGAIEID